MKHVQYNLKPFYMSILLEPLKKSLKWDPLEQSVRNQVVLPPHNSLTPPLSLKM